MTIPPTLSPLRVRPGARYTCFGDGLCCTNIHGLGPLTEDELVQIRKIDPQGVETDEQFDEPMLRTGSDGGCVFLLGDLRCSIHAKLGPEKKPTGCRRFPLGLVATPSGGRITTEHRCPCRTMGDRPTVTEEAAAPSLKDESGSLAPDHVVQHINLEPGRRVAFAEWERMEEDMLARLTAGERPEQVLGMGPFPPLRGSTWRQEAEELHDAEDSSQFKAMLDWFADGILVRNARFRPPARERPWSSAFDRAETRGGAQRTADQVLADWVADEIWTLGWAGRHPFSKASLDIVTRLAVGREITKRIERLGVHEGRAAAEAVTVIDGLGPSEYWSDIVNKIRTPGSGRRSAKQRKQRKQRRSQANSRT